MIKLLTALAALVGAFCASAGAFADTTEKMHWIGSWARAMSSGAEIEGDEIGGRTVRNYVRLTAGGPRLRLRFSNAFNDQPLRIEGISVAHAVSPGKDQIDPASSRNVTFGGQPFVVLPPGADYVSDPIVLPTAAGNTIAVTFRVPVAPSVGTMGAGPRGTSFIASDDVPTNAASLADAKTSRRFYMLSGVHVLAPTRVGTIAVIGDSITDHGGGSIDGTDRWTEVLAGRLQQSDEFRGWGVVNLGIAGGRVARHGTAQAATARMERDIYSQPGLRTVLVFEGVNDLGKLSREFPVNEQTRSDVVHNVIEGYRQLALRARDDGVRIVGMTILPFSGTKTYRSGPDANADRQELNAWLCTSGQMDAGIALDPLMADPTAPSELLVKFDRGDGLHPNVLGQQAIGMAIPLSVLKPGASPNRCFRPAIGADEMQMNSTKGN